MYNDTSNVLIIVYLVILVISIAAFWRIFTKAGKPGWAVLIPIYNIIVLLEICEKPVWWILLLLIPLVNIIIMIVVYVALLEKFGKPGWHVILLLLFGIIYIPYLGFSNAQYKA